MPNRNYQKGRRFEYAVMKYLRDRGYYTVRSYASKGLFDVIAVPPKTPSNLKTPAFLTFHKPEIAATLLIQCKTNGYVPPAERSALAEASRRYLGKVIVAKRSNRKIVFEDA